jgi:DNA-binding MarR family transcriptional regulator
MPDRKPSVSKEELIERAHFRHRLRLFERFTEEACAEAGITMPQYLLLLQLAGRPEKDWALIGELAECLVLRHHTAVELTNRCEAAGFVVRERDTQDLRRVRVHLTAAGARIVSRIVRAHRQEFDVLRTYMGQRFADEPSREENPAP